jgi:hypothetical protein
MQHRNAHPPHGMRRASAHDGVLLIRRKRSDHHPLYPTCAAIPERLHLRNTTAKA